MERLQVVTENKTYDIVIEASFDCLPEEIQKLQINYSKIAIISDDTVSSLYSKEIENLLKPHFHEVFTCSFPSGEANKHLGTVTELYRFMLHAKLDRKSLVIALGGGVTGDMVGFAAATFMRGIAFMQVPTTLLSQVDSSIGGKTAVDFEGYKNLVGAFYQPELVYINTATLKTLPKKELISGMGEVVKHGIIWDTSYLEDVYKHSKEVLNLDHEVMSRVIVGSCKIKSLVVGQDERENGLRTILNFGHTAGHSIEKLKNFELTHGVCVALGMIVALYISKAMNYISLEDIEYCRKVMMAYEMPMKVQGITAREVYNEMFLDKKTSHNCINYVLVNPMGKAVMVKDLPENIILQGIEEVIGE